MYSLTLEEEKLFSEKLTIKFVSNWGLGVWAESKLPRLSRGGLVADPSPFRKSQQSSQRTAEPSLLMKRGDNHRGGQTAAAAALCLGSAEAVSVLD